MSLPTIAFLGAGSMAHAIISGLRRSGIVIDGGIRTTNRSAAKAAELAELDGVVARATETDAAANLVAVKGAKLVVVAVKPSMVPNLMREIAGALAPGTVVISVAPAIGMATYESLLPATIAVIRAMPNTPALVGRAVTGISAGTRSSDADLALAVSLFDAIGDVLIVPEVQLDALSTISGSGPAYVFLLIEQLTAAAIRMGFTQGQAALMVQGTFRGAIELLIASGSGPGELRQRVMSPGGTTERAVDVLIEAQFEKVFARAAGAAIARIHELGGDEH